jgi:hypothetical protein
MWRVYLFFFIALMMAMMFACKSEDPVSPSSENLTSADRDKFIGNWAGTYQCTNLPGDTLIISAGNGELNFGIILHAHTGDPDPEIVSGQLTRQNTITIPEQTIAGFPGSATITYSNSVLSLSQRGLGITCQGTYSVKF